MHRILLVSLGAAFGAVAISPAGAATPFPAGYEDAYRSFIAALPPAGKQSPWLTRLNGVTAPATDMTIGGKPVVYLFGCKNHFCDTDNVNVFLAPDRKNFMAVLRIAGRQSLLGGAGAAEVACVEKLEASGGATAAC